MINEVLKGITDALYAAFGDDYEIHTEASMQDMEEPAFFVRCINPDVPRGLTGRRKATLLFIVQYFPESDEPKKEINTVYERLSECLDLIEVEGNFPGSSNANRRSALPAYFLEPMICSLV